MGNKATKANATAAATAAPATAPQAAPQAAPVAAATLPVVAAANVPSAPPKGTHARAASGKGANPMPRSTVQGPVGVAWALYASLYAQHGPALTRKQATTAAMAAGVAFYTARTQYQLWRQAMLNAAQAPAPASA